MSQSGSREHALERVVGRTAFRCLAKIVRVDVVRALRSRGVRAKLVTTDRVPKSVSFAPFAKSPMRLWQSAIGIRRTKRIAVVSSFPVMVLPEEVATNSDPQPADLSIYTLAAKLRVGDVIFIRVDAKPMREVSAATGSWTNHVGIVVDISGTEPVIGESTFPVSGTTTLARFIARSEGGRVAVSRLKWSLTGEQRQRLVTAAHSRAGIVYDTGFNVRSRRQFCSRYVYEVLAEATGISVGDVETFESLLVRNPEADLAFWRLWYFGRIPWCRETVTPASLLEAPELTPIFDGVVAFGVTQ